jgi:hypothetical protein
LDTIEANTAKITPEGGRGEREPIVAGEVHASLYSSVRAMNLWVAVFLDQYLAVALARERTGVTSLTPLSAAPSDSYLTRGKETDAGASHR